MPPIFATAALVTSHIWSSGWLLPDHFTLFLGWPVKGMFTTLHYVAVSPHGWFSCINLCSQQRYSQYTKCIVRPTLCCLLCFIDDAILLDNRWWISLLFWHRKLLLLLPLNKHYSHYLNGWKWSHKLLSLIWSHSSLGLSNLQAIMFCYSYICTCIAFIIIILILLIIIIIIFNILTTSIYSKFSLHFNSASTFVDAFYLHSIPPPVPSLVWVNKIQAFHQNVMPFW